MACCPSNWWQAPIYLTSSAVLAFFAISTAMHSLPNSATPQIKPINHPLYLNASRALRLSGFNIIATLLQISPDIFLSSPNSTIFAIQDSAFFNTSLPPWLLKYLLQYHTSPLNLSMDDLLKKPQGSCIPTLLPPKHIAVTKVDVIERLVDINGVLVSHPDVFLEGTLSIHGVLGPFSSLDPQDVYHGWDYIQSPICNSKSSLVLDLTESNTMVEWTQIIRWLSSNGFVSFAIGLHSVLDGILEDSPNLSAITIFTPLDFMFVASPSPLLDKIVRLHILPQRLTYLELSSLPNKASLRTLVPCLDLEISVEGNFRQGITINRVHIVIPDLFSSKNFVIHGISEAFETAELLNTSM